LRLDGEFLGSVALVTIDQTLSHPPHLFNGIPVRAIGPPMKIGAETALSASFVSFSTWGDAQSSWKNHSARSIHLGKQLESLSHVVLDE
jgi:hypothetical protein